MAVASVLLMLSAIGSTAVLYDHRVEHMTNPIGVDNTSPTFSWKVTTTKAGADSTRGVKVTAAEVNVIAAGGKTMWNSGRVKQNTTWMSYNGMIQCVPCEQR